MQRIYILVIFLFLCIVSCRRDEMVLTRMEEIQAMGETDPLLALKMLDSIKAEVGDQSAYIQNKYHLLDARLNDKAFIQPSSDIMIRKLVDYFQEYGSDAERQEVLYYAGSVYRDLNDTPKALLFFHQSKDIATEHPGECDSLMLARAYSNLSWLYYMVQDYENALDMAQQEWNVFSALGMENPRTLVHIGTAQLKRQDTQGAAATFRKALGLAQQSKYDSTQAELYSALLYQFSYLKMKEEATECRRRLLPYEKEMLYSTDDYLAMGEFYKLNGQPDSMVYCLKQVLDGDMGGEGMYDATKILFDFYDRKGDVAEANRYARWFVTVCDTLNLGGRQQLAATVNNQYQYHRNEREEQLLRQENSRNKSILLFLVLASSLMMTGGLLFFFYRKNRRLKEYVATQDELLQLRQDKHALEEELRDQQSQIESMKTDVREKGEQMAFFEAEIARYDQDSAVREKELRMKIEQNKSLIGMLNQLHFAVNHEDVIQNVMKAAEGRYEMKEKDWDAFCSAFDMIYPDFKGMLAEKLGKFSRKQMIVCYLMRIGISPSQIQHLLNLPRTTVWRWTGKFSQILSVGK